MTHFFPQVFELESSKMYQSVRNLLLNNILEYGGIKKKFWLDPEAPKCHVRQIGRFWQFLHAQVVLIMKFFLKILFAAMKWALNLPMTPVHMN